MAKGTGGSGRGGSGRASAADRVRIASGGARVGDYVRDRAIPFVSGRVVGLGSISFGRRSIPALRVDRGGGRIELMIANQVVARR
jgi:hypothetical protein